MLSPSFPFTPRRHPHLYEINTWTWLDSLSQNAGREIRLSDVPDQEWDTLQNRGFDLVWLMGVWQRSPESQRIARTEKSLFPRYDRALPDWKPEDIVGSPYAVRAYVPDTRIGDWSALEKTREKLHHRGMGLILDFVPNHTARDHDWIETHPDFYVQGSAAQASQNPDLFFHPHAHTREVWIAHGKDPYFPAWTDTAQLQYFNPATREAMLGELTTISAYCDGVRCDMAMLILNRIFGQTWGERLYPFPMPAQEFWSEVRNALPQLMLIAEVYWNVEWELQQLGFDYTYDKRLYDRLRSRDMHGIRAHLTADLSFQDKLVRFLENHDEPRSAAVFNKQELRAALTIMSTLPGMRLYHQGQIEGRRLHLPVQLRRSQPERDDPEILQWHNSILKLTDSPIFHDGVWHLLHVSFHHDQTFQAITAHAWQLDHDVRIIVVNGSSTLAQGRIVVPPKLLAWMKNGVSHGLKDILNQTRMDFSMDDDLEDGLLVRLDPWAVHMLSLFPASS